MTTVLVTGKDGQLGKCIRDCVSKGDNTNRFVFVGHDEFDITNRKQCDEYIIKNGPFDYLINCAAYTNVNKAEVDYDNAYKVNAEGVRNLGELCTLHTIRLIHISTDYVYNGIKAVNYEDSNECLGPLNAYGKTKLAGEEELLKYHGLSYVVIRTSWLYSEYGTNFVKTIISRLRNNQPLSVIYDQIGSPTNAHDLADVIVNHIIMESLDMNYGFFFPMENPIYNFSNEGCISWYDFASLICELYCEESANNNKLVGYTINPIETKMLSSKCQRPSISLMSKSKIKNDYKSLARIPFWYDSLKMFIHKNYNSLSGQN